MAEKYPQIDTLRWVSGGADVWDDEQAGPLLIEGFFDAAPASDPVYLGGGSRATRYVGAKVDADIYLGAKTLWP